MGRNRSKRNAWLPPGVYADKWGYYVRKPYRRLAGLKSPRSEVWAAYEALSGGPEHGSLRWLVSKYIASDRFSGLKSQRDIENALNRVLRARVKGGEFGDVRLTAITRGVIRRYLDARPAAGGNREITYLRMAYKWAMNRDLVRENPCEGIEWNREQAKSRYVTDKEYQAVYIRADDVMKVIMELVYLTACRRSEVVAIRRSDMLPEGLRIGRLKGSRTNVVAWSPRLRNAVDRAWALPSRVTTFYLIHDRNGQPITPSALSKRWQRLQAGFRLHDLKHKGVTDAEEKNVAGHKSRAMQERYDHSEPVVRPVK